ncbi:hypothetical protein RIF29_14279 [Crotalaria pallida]|uniref:Uncharacterized protein n=1 Tax=Crotalaria pallida TaxID=3830 RepID=A0AAN9FD42_CROPI
MAKRKGRYGKSSPKTAVHSMMKETQKEKIDGSSVSRNGTGLGSFLDLESMESALSEEDLSKAMNKDSAEALIKKMEELVTKMKSKARKSWADRVEEEEQELEEIHIQNGVIPNSIRKESMNWDM